MLNPSQENTRGLPQQHIWKEISVHAWNEQLLKVFGKRLIQFLKHPWRRLPGEKET
jgi:hypothetical protein